MLARGDLRSVFQPIVDLETGGLFGYEALVRGPEGTSLAEPAGLFAAALFVLAYFLFPVFSPPLSPTLTPEQVAAFFGSVGARRYLGQLQLPAAQAS